MTNPNSLLLKRKRKKGAERGLNLWHGRDFFAPTPCVRQPLFETSDSNASPNRSRFLRMERDELRRTKHFSAKKRLF